MKTLELPKQLENSLDQYAQATQQKPEVVILHLVEEFLSVKESHQIGIQEALAEDDIQGIHFTHETMGKWVYGLRNGVIKALKCDA